MPGTPAARTPAAAPKQARLQKARPPLIRTGIDSDDRINDSDSNAGASDRGGKSARDISPAKKRDVSPTKKREPLSKSGQGGNTTNRKSSAENGRDISTGGETKPERRDGKSKEKPSSAYASPYQQSARARKGKPSPEPKSFAPTLVPRSPTALPSENGTDSPLSPGAFSEKSTSTVGLAGRGASDGPESAIKAQVVEALHVLDRLEARADVLGSPSETASKSAYGAQMLSAWKGGPAAVYGNKTKKKAEERKQLGTRRDHAVQVARGIMRKMYRKNVALEKENRVLKTELYGQRKRVAAAKSETDPTLESSLQEKERAIAQLTDMVGDLQSRLRKQEEAVPRGRKPSRTAPGTGDLGANGESYKKLRADYQSLLTSRIDAVKKRGGASEEVTKMLSDMRERLLQETAERETETARYNARLCETEQQNADWYAEKKLLEQHIMQLERELLERDQIDQQIEACIGSLFERMQILERTNQELNDMAAHYSQVAESTSPVGAAPAAG